MMQGQHGVWWWEGRNREREEKERHIGKMCASQVII
jgi:hypothetical protein